MTLVRIAPLLLSVYLGGVCLLPSCETDHDTLTGVEVTMRTAHHVDGTPLEFDTMTYVNAQGNHYSVTRLQYYLHGLRLIGTADHTVADAFLVNGRENLPIRLSNVPVGHYSGISLVMGLVPEANVSGGLPGTVANMQMVWPDQMGGGYHFLKLEGRYSPSFTANTHGYAIHLGNNGCQVYATVNQAFDVQEGTEFTLHLNLNETFHGPNPYDLDSANYTMGDMHYMQLVAANLSDAFTLTVAP